MTILFAGDTHGDQRWLCRVVSKVKPSALVHLGDVQLEEDAEQALGPVLSTTRFLWVAGYHDHDSVDYYRRLHSQLLAPGALHGRVLVVEGLRIAGLGGWFQDDVWRPPSRPLPGRKPRVPFIDSRKDPELVLRAVRHSGAIWWEEYEALWNQRADILVCHEARSAHRHGYQAIDELGQAMGVHSIFHGHHHATYSGRIAGGIRVFGIGLRAVVDQDGQVIHKGEGRA